MTAGTGDPLMHKLAAVIQPMKSSFIVAHLKPRDFVVKMQVSPTIHYLPVHCFVRVSSFGGLVVGRMASKI